MNDDKLIASRIDQTLRKLGSAAPAAGIEDRINARLAQAQRLERNTQNIIAPTRLFSLPRLAFSGIAAGLACTAIIAGSVNHSHRILPIAPGVQLPIGASGIGAASAAHIATQPVSPSPGSRPRSMRQTTAGRAVLSVQSQKPAGVAVPKHPSPETKASQP